MRTQVILATFATVLMTATAATASNELVLLNQDVLLNQAQVDIAGAGNRLIISQEHTGGAGANIVTATINGDLNGGPLGASFTGAALASGLQPGTIVQSGFNNAMTIKVDGTSNLFAFSQNGSGNRLDASIAGYGNQAAVVQTGTDNYASFSQNGVGNIVSISQHSW